MQELTWMSGLVALLLAFLLGSIPFGFLIGKLNGLDMRREGSGNIGATNVWRVLGPRWGGLAFLLDFTKGFLPVFCATRFFDSAAPHHDLWMIGLSLVAILGHNFTPWLGFKGGKGIATSAGVLGAILPWTLALSLSLWIVLTLCTRIVSIGSIAASISLPIVTYFFYPQQWSFFWFAFTAGALGLWQHRANIKRLSQGTEPKFKK